MTSEATASGYHTPVSLGVATKEVGAWTLSLGLLPDGRYAVDYFNTYALQRTRHYFDAKTDALAEYDAFGAERI